MKSESIIQRKCYCFSIRIVKIYRYLIKEHKKYLLTKQILRSGTSIGANVEEASGGQSKRDFLSKLSIEYIKEATRYWLRILKDTNFINKVIFNSFINGCEELLRILSKIQTTVKANLEKNNL